MYLPTIVLVTSHQAKPRCKTSWGARRWNRIGRCYLLFLKVSLFLQCSTNAFRTPSIFTGSKQCSLGRNFGVEWLLRAAKTCENISRIHCQNWTVDLSLAVFECSVWDFWDCGSCMVTGSFRFEIFDTWHFVSGTVNLQNEINENICSALFN